MENTFANRYKNRGLLDALLNISQDDPAKMDINNVADPQALIAALNRPTNEDKKTAFWNSLAAMGGKQSLGESLQAFGNTAQQSMQQGRQNRLGELEQQLTLKKLFAPKAPTRRESFGKDPQGNPIKFYENVWEDGKVERVKDSEIPMYRPNDMTEYQKALLAFKQSNPQSSVSGSDFVVLDTPSGSYNYNKVTKEIVPITVDGKNVVRTSSDATFAADKESAKNAVKAAANLPQIEQNTKEAISVIDNMINNKAGREYRTGFSSIVPAIPGTSGADFQANADRLKGTVFLKAFEALKGGGQITEIEGKKAEAAMARLQEAQTEESYLAALNELKASLGTALEAARGKAGVQKSNGDNVIPSVSPPPATGFVIRRKD
jgi:hypothetical protein